MHVTRSIAAMALAGAALGMAAPLAAAVGDPGDSGPSNIIVTPKTVKQGAALTVTVDGSSCRGAGRTYDAVVESNAFPRTPLQGMATQGVSYAMPQIFAAAKPGAYDVTATCGGKTVTGGGFTVAGKSATEPVTASASAAGPTATSASASTAPSAAASPAPSMPAKGARAGAGSSAKRTNSTETALGATVFAAAVAGTGVYLIRRRASGKA